MQIFIFSPLSPSFSLSLSFYKAYLINLYKQIAHIKDKQVDPANIQLKKIPDTEISQRLKVFSNQDYVSSALQDFDITAYILNKFKNDANLFELCMSIQSKPSVSSTNFERASSLLKLSEIDKRSSTDNDMYFCKLNDLLLKYINFDSIRL
jgi:hypothetical protein